MRLHDTEGQRLYLTETERKAFLKAAESCDRQVRTFCMVLVYTGCRLSEALGLTPKSIDFGQKAIVIETLKKRRSGVFRAVPVPDSLLDTLNMVHGIQEASRRKSDPSLNLPLWRWSRPTAWRRVGEVMERAGIQDGAHKCPKGLRHGYGVAAVSKGIPLNMLSKWMGHASLEVTAIYANALGEEQRSIAARMW
jgi:integrase/recombinase XerD